MCVIVMEAIALSTPKRDAKTVAVVIRGNNGVASVHKSRDSLRETLDRLRDEGAEVRRAPTITFRNHDALDAWTSQVSGLLPHVL